MNSKFNKEILAQYDLTASEHKLKDLLEMEELTDEEANSIVGGALAISKEFLEKKPSRKLLPGVQIASNWETIYYYPFTA